MGEIKKKLWGKNSAMGEGGLLAGHAAGAGGVTPDLRSAARGARFSPLKKKRGELGRQAEISQQRQAAPRENGGREHLRGASLSSRAAKSRNRAVRGGLLQGSGRLL